MFFFSLELILLSFMPEKKDPSVLRELTAAAPCPRFLIIYTFWASVMSGVI